MDSKFPWDGKTIKQILEESRRNNKPLESNILEFKPFWELNRKWDKEKKDFIRNSNGIALTVKDGHIKQKNLEELAGFANTKGGVMLIGIEDNGKVVEISDNYYENISSPEKLQQTIQNHLNDAFKGFGAIGFKVEHEELPKDDGTKIIIFRIDVAESKTLVFVDGKLFVRNGERNVLLDAEEAINFEKRKSMKNKILDEKFHDGVPDFVKTQYKEISDKFDKENYQDSTNHLYRLMREVMQKKYDKLDWKFKYSKILPGVLAATLYNYVLFVTLITSVMFFLGAEIVYDRTVPFWLGSIFFAFLITTSYAHGERKWLLERVAPGGIPIIFSMWRMHPPSSICLTLLWCIVTRQKKIEIEILVWALIWFECFNGPSEDTYQSVKQPQHHGESYGNVIFELASTDEAIRINNIKPREAVMQYLLQNSMLMLNSLYSPELSEVQMP
jgi:uncharacterized membrane protein (DUF485 family)